jgi:hypothetical protein
MHQQRSSQDLVFSYLQLRKAVGIIGCALPFVLVIGKILLQGCGIQPSISAYYYTDMRGVFVGSLCAIGMFLMSCKGYDPRDQRAGVAACAFAIGVALFPTTPLTDATPQEVWIGGVHLTFAALLFLTLAYFSLFLFTETNPSRTPTAQKLRRNKVYRTCGGIILACILLMFVLKLTSLENALKSLEPVFWLESTAVTSFGFSWLTNGETILKDR